MGQPDQALDADDLLALAERAAQLPAADAEWVGRLFQEVLRARSHEAELLRQAERVGEPDAAAATDDELDDRLVQVAFDTAEWLRTLWEVGYMGAGSFRSEPRSAFPSVDLEDIRRSSLFARIRRGKHVLPFPPPTRHGLPWHALLDSGEQTHAVAAEIIGDESGAPLGAIIEGCPEWNVIRQTTENQEYVVQHQGKGPTYRLRLAEGGTAQLRREPPASTRKIRLEGHSGFHRYTLEWPEGDGQTRCVTLRAATWERAESEAERWLANTHPEMYGQIRFEKCDD